MLLFIVFFLSTVIAAEVTKLQNLKGDAVFHPLKDFRTNKCVSDASFLRCEASAPCQFGPSPDSPWFQMDGYADYKLWKTSVGTDTTSDPPSLAVQLGSTDSPFGLLTSDPVPCLSSGGSLIFKFWSTINVMLRVCLISISTQREILCSDELNQRTESYPGPITINIPSEIVETFVIQFMASTEPGVEGFLLLDDVYFFGEVCDSPDKSDCNGSGNGSQVVRSTESIITVPTTHAITSKPVNLSTNNEMNVTTTLPTSVFTYICHSVPCNFEISTCSYIISNKGTALWDRDNTRLTNDVVDTLESWWNSVFCNSQNGCNHQDQGYYMTANIEGNESVAILSSPKFEPSSNKQLMFKYYRAIAGHTIKICFETNSKEAVFDSNWLKQCQNAIPPLNWFSAMIWNTATVKIPDSSTQFHLVAMHEGVFPGTGPITVDEIVVKGC